MSGGGSTRRGRGGATDLRLSLLGGFQLHRSGSLLRLPLAAQRLVAFLALQGRPRPRGYVAGTLWPETPEARAAANLRSALWRMQTHECGLLEISGPEIALGRRVTVDVHDLTTTARLLLVGAPRDVDVDTSTAAFLNELLPGWYEEWVILERERLREVCLRSLEALSAHLSQTGRIGEAIQVGFAAVALEPLRESAHRAIIAAYVAEGNVAEALRHYERYRCRLRADLGLEPSRQIEALVPMAAVRYLTRDEQE